MLSMCSIKAQAPPPSLVPVPPSFTGFPNFPVRPVPKRPGPFGPGSGNPPFIQNMHSSHTTADRVAHSFLDPVLNTKLSVRITNVTWPVIYVQVVSTQIAKISQIQKKLFEKQSTMRLNPGLKVSFQYKFDKIGYRNNFAYLN